jgi:hypothetical protein
VRERRVSVFPAERATLSRLPDRQIRAGLQTVGMVPEDRRRLPVLSQRFVPETKGRQSILSRQARGLLEVCQDHQNAHLKSVSNSGFGEPRSVEVDQ